MSQRERWIVYPLLFLALGLALRDKLVSPKSLTAGTVSCYQLEVLGQADCHQLTVRDGEGNPRIRLGVVNHGGQLELDTRTAGTVWCDQLEVLGQAECHQLTVRDGEGNPRIRLGVVNHGGQLELDTREGQTALILGTDDDELRYGLFALRPGWKRLVPLSLYDKPALAPEGKHPPSGGTQPPPTREGRPQPSEESPQPPGKSKTE